MVLEVGVGDGIRVLNAAALCPALHVLSRIWSSWSPARSAPDSDWQADHTSQPTGPVRTVRSERWPSQ
jgi:hypothetical protein